MGFNLLAFAGGAAKGFTTEVDKAEEEARVRAIESTKMLYTNYAAVKKENKTLEAEAGYVIGKIKAYYPDATEDQLYAIAMNKPVADDLVKKLDSKEYDPDSFNLNSFAKVIPDGATSTVSALDRIRKAYSILPTSDAATKIINNPNAGFFEKIGATAANTAAMQTANSLGISLASLQGARDYRAPAAPTNVVFDLKGLAPAQDIDNVINKEQVKLSKLTKGTTEYASQDAIVKSVVEIKNNTYREPTWQQVTDSAKVAVLKASQSGKPEEIQKAKDNLLAVNSADELLSDPHKKFMSEIASYKSKAVSGTPEEKKVANAWLSKWFALEGAEAVAKKPPTNDQEKAPALGSLITFANKAMNNLTTSQFGTMPGMAISTTINSVTGETMTSLEYTGEDNAVRQQVQAFKQKAWTDSLSFWVHNGVPLNTSVAAALSAAPRPRIRDAGTIPAEPAPPALPTLGGGTPSVVPRAAASAAPAAAPAERSLGERRTSSGTVGSAAAVPAPPVTEVKQATQKEVDLFAAQKEISREKARKALVDAGYIIVP